MSKRVLLTGVGGFIGAHTVQWILQNTDWDLVGIESWRPEHVNSAKRLQDVLAPLTAEQRSRFTVHRWDLTHEFTKPICNQIFTKEIDVIISGYDKQLVGEIAAKIRKVRPCDPYQAKGIRYADEVVRRLEGKTFGAA